MPNTILLNGASAGRCRPLAEQVRAGLTAEFAARSWKTAVHDLAGMKISPCRGCFACWVKTPGKCIIRDDADKVMPDLAGAEVVALLTPVTFGGYGYELKKAMDRCIPILLPFMEIRSREIHHPHRYPVKRRLLAVGLLPNPDPQAEAIFRRLIARNALNMAALATSVLVLDETAGSETVTESIRTAVAQLEVA